ncbi:MAG: thioredoxin [Firmicutes bacterium]|nr:thioredoxin [Bacillota bacterium]
MSQIMTVTTSTIETDVLKATRPILVDFWATWCGPCRMVSPILEELAQEWADKLTIAKLDVDAEPAIAAKYQIMSIPTMILFKDGQEVTRLMGAMPKAAIKQRIEPHL